MSPPLELAIVGNKPPVKGARLLSAAVLALSYIHEEDHTAYKHDFGPGVELWALPDGSMMLRHLEKPLWDDQ